MGPEIKVGKRLQTKMVASTYNSNDTFAKELEDELMKFTATCENEVEHLVQPTERAQVDSDIEVDITTVSGGNGLVEPQLQQTTESSSSFDDTDSEVEYSNEASSNFHGDEALEMDFDVVHETFKMRNKKVTSHWRSYIQPLMWRCKWAELQIRKLHSQAQKYDKKMEMFNHQKQGPFHVSEGTAVKSLSFSEKDASNEVLRRKKRRRAETTLNLAEYSSHHTIFSYYENRKGVANDAFMDDMPNNSANTTRTLDNEEEFLTNDEPGVDPGAEGRDNALEHILRKIFILEPQIEDLKHRVAKINSENAGKFSSTDNLSNLLLQSSNPSISSPGNTTIAPQLISDCNPTDDLFLSESLITAREILIDNQRVKDEMTIEAMEKPFLVNDGVRCSAPGLEELKLPKEEQSPLGIISNSMITKGKRKMGKRKGANPK